MNKKTCSSVSILFAHSFFQTYSQGYRMKGECQFYFTVAWEAEAQAWSWVTRKEKDGRGPWDVGQVSTSLRWTTGDDAEQITGCGSIVLCSPNQPGEMWMHGNPDSLWPQAISGRSCRQHGLGTTDLGKTQYIHSFSYYNPKPWGKPHSRIRDPPKVLL